MGMTFLQTFVWRNDISTALGKKRWLRTSVHHFFPCAVEISFLHTKVCRNAPFYELKSVTFYTDFLSSPPPPLMKGDRKGERTITLLYKRCHILINLVICAVQWTNNLIFLLFRYLSRSLSIYLSLSLSFSIFFSPLLRIYGPFLPFFQFNDKKSSLKWCIWYFKYYNKKHRFIFLDHYCYLNLETSRLFSNVEKCIFRCKSFHKILYIVF